MLTPLEQFQIIPLLSIHLFNNTIDLSITNSSIFLFLLLIILLYYFETILNNTKYIPNAWQSLLENLYIFIMDLINQNCHKQGQQYFIFFFTLFLFIIGSNLIGMIPYSFTTTSHLVITLTLSFMIWIGVTIIGLIKHQFHFFTLFVPSGAPAAMLPALIFIEILSYIIRALSLGLRLFANMMSGHTLLKIFASFSFLFTKNGGMIGYFAAFIPLFLIYLITGLELGIACLQAYVFTILSIMYLNDSLALH